MDDVHGVRVFGGTYAAPIWSHFMSAALKNTPVVDFQAPPSSNQWSQGSGTGP
jgi:membrane carboxypeptidase/penicillin-binding protein